MKRFWMFAATLLLAGAVVLALQSPAAAEQSQGCSNTQGLIDTVNRHIQSQVEAGAMPAWQGAQAGFPTPYYDLDGNVVVYMLPVLVGEKEVGYAVVQAENCLVIEFASNSVPHKDALDDATSLAEAWGLHLDEQHPLYFGPFDKYFAFSSSDDVTSDSYYRVLWNMMDHSSIILDNEQNVIPSVPDGNVSRTSSCSHQPEEVVYSEAYSTDDYKLLSAPSYLQWCVGSCLSGCSPNAGGTLMGYWADRGYPNLVSGGSGGDYQGTILNLRNRAGTVCCEGASYCGNPGFGCTDWEDLSPAMDGFAAERGYDGFESSYYYPLYAEYQSEINHDRPVVADFNGYWGGQWVGPNHATTGVGYDTVGGNYMLVIPNLSGNQSPVKVLFGSEYTSFHINTLMPPDVPPTTSHSIAGTIGENGWYISTPQITLTSQDNFGGSGVSYIRYRIDGGSWVTYSAPVSISTDGQKLFEYQAVDNGGHWETIKSFSIKVDTTGPTNPTSTTPGCAASSNVWQATCNDASFTWSGASDATSGVAGYEYDWGPNSAGNPPATWTTGNTYDPPAIPEGSYYLRIRTKDNAGNWSSWQTAFILRYDATAPTGSLLINNDASTSYATLVRLQIAAADSMSGVGQMRIRDIGGDWGDWQTFLSSGMYWLLPAASGQTHTVEIQYQDRAGNTSTVYSDAIYLNVYPTRPSSENYSLVKSTWSASWSDIHPSTSLYSLNGTLGQPSMIGNMRSDQYTICSGYWSSPCQPTFNFTTFLPLVTR